MAGEICGICEEIIEGLKIMGLTVDHAVVDGKQVLVHYDCRFKEPEGGIIAGRIIPHGGCGPID